MKRIFSSIIIAAFVFFTASAQIMNSNGYRNTVWTGFGNAWNSENSITDSYKLLDSVNWAYLGDDNDVHWTGVTDTFQGCIGAGALTLDVMLQWGGLSIYDANDDLDSLKIKYLDSDVNFILALAKNFDIAMGTYLNWNLGPAPTHGGNSWEIGYHLKQGGLSYGTPSKGLVAGATYYANYINHSMDLSDNPSGFIEPITQALALRYTIADVLQLAAAIPSETTTSDFIANIGARFTPTDTVLVAAAYNGIFRGDSNMYAGLTLGIDAISVDAWLGMNNMGGKKDNQITGFGGAINFAVNTWTLRPEAGLTFYENKDYSMAMYAGINLAHELSENIELGIWGSFAFGSDDDGGSTETGGKIFDLRPNLTYYINNTDALAATYEYQMVTVFTDDTFNFWNLGLFWTHQF